MNDNQPVPVEQLTYNQALAELESIVNTLQSSNCDIDAMVTMTKRAADLLKFCRTRLTTTDKQLREALEALQQPE